MNRFFFVLITLSLIALQESIACTSIIISGKATADGRPLMWKHRDTSEPLNHIGFSEKDGFSYLGLINSKEGDRDVWIGTNAAGFSIMNTASFNLKNDDIKEMDNEGRLMRLALLQCRTIKDFETMLDTMARPLRVEANFGVIDANGGAAYYETDNTKYIKRDVNDPKEAPNGYIIYTNYSFTGRKDGGYGYIRYVSAVKIFKDMEKDGLTVQNIFKKASRSFYNSFLEIDLMKKEQSPNNSTGWFLEQDMIPRRESTAAIVIHGVKPGMNPELVVMWTALGYPPTAIAVPLWESMKENQPAIALYDSKLKSAPLSIYANKLRDNVYENRRGSGLKYIHWARLWNDENSGYIQILDKMEDKIFKLVESKRSIIERGGKLNKKVVEDVYNEMSTIVKNSYDSIK